MFELRLGHERSRNIALEAQRVMACLDGDVSDQDDPVAMFRENDTSASIRNLVRVAMNDRAYTASAIDATQGYPSSGYVVSDSVLVLDVVSEAVRIDGMFDESDFDDDRFKRGSADEGVERNGVIVKGVTNASVLLAAADGKASTRFWLRLGRKVDAFLRSIGARDKSKPTFFLQDFPEFKGTDTLPDVQSVMLKACDALDRPEARQFVLDHFDRIAEVTGLDVNHAAA